MTQVDIRKYDPAAHVFGAPKVLADEAVAEPVAGGALDYARTRLANGCQILQRKVISVLDNLVLFS